MVEPGIVNVSINIDEGEEVQIEEITFHGNEAFDDDDLKDAMEETRKVDGGDLQILIRKNYEDR